ncbi:MAG: DUF5017 domain-containing protein [Candidatus Cryptobacteroides sp.]
MKKIHLIFAAVVFVTACQQDVVYKIDYTVSLDKSNTYIAGQPVRFNFSGDVDNIVFYSGERGSQYKFRSRYEVPMEAVKSASIDIDYKARYGNAGALEVYVSKEFDGLDGSDGAADRQTIKEMYEGGMQGWDKLEYKEGASDSWTYQTYDLTDYKDNFSIAFHWCPQDNTKTQRWYLLNGTITMDLDIEGMDYSQIDFGSMDMVSVMMNEEVENPYYKNQGNGSINFDKTDAHIVMQGVAANVLPYAIDGWVISRPIPLNKVANDKGTVIKNLQNYLHTFEYTWEEPGTYTVTFVGTNANYLASSQKVCEMTVSIIAPPFDD